MSSILILSLFFLVLVIAAVFLYLVKNNISSEITKLKDKIDQNLIATQTTLLNSQETVSQSLQRVSKDLGAVNYLGEQLQQNMRSFENILQKPSMRGGVGEYLLESLIKDALPEGKFDFQYSFKNNLKADAVIFLAEGILAIDSKFTLEDFNSLVEVGAESKDKLTKVFFRNIKGKIDETSKYILPSEGTFDFAFMYVPSENIYYEIINNPRILDYAHSKKVFIVGPNAFYAYLKTILIGFEGMRIQQETKKILSHIKSLEVDFSRIQESFSVLGSHLNNSLARYNDLNIKISETASKITAFQDTA